jgi:hypothetical protein
MTQEQKLREKARRLWTGTHITQVEEYLRASYIANMLGTHGIDAPIEERWQITNEECPLDRYCEYCGAKDGETGEHYRARVGLNFPHIPLISSSEMFVSCVDGVWQCQWCRGITGRVRAYQPYSGKRLTRQAREENDEENT